MISNIKDIFRKHLLKFGFGYAENDGFNRLVLETNCLARNSHAAFLYKILAANRIYVYQNYIEQALINNADITKALVRLYSTFDPAYRCANY